MTTIKKLGEIPSCFGKNISQGPKEIGAADQILRSACSEYDPNKPKGLAAEIHIANLKGAKFQISEENQEGYAQ